MAKAPYGSQQWAETRGDDLPDDGEPNPTDDGDEAPRRRRKRRRLTADERADRQAEYDAQWGTDNGGLVNPMDREQ